MKYKIALFGLFYGFLMSAQAVKSPSEFLGYELGSRFSRHHQVMAYYRYLAETTSDKIKFQPYGETYEHRPLTLLFVSSPENIARLEDIRQEHLKSTKGQGNADKAIVWLSYNVHGNESVSTEAAMQTVYELITQKQDWLKNIVVIIDPCLNPDGRERYVNWYYQSAGTPHQPDPQSKEHNEPWLNGRTNHYMFDLNRDWAWITQAESRQRLQMYNRWLPHVHVDFHEQGVDEPYYFAPAAEPLHEVITDWQREFQVTIGKNHARYFDEKGWFYFTKETFDLFYPSYGDTYPAFTGAIGMTYEQGGSGHAGLGVITRYGDTLTLGERIAHHHTTGLSTVETAAGNAAKLVSEFKKFYTHGNYTYKSYVLSGNPDHIEALTRLLDAHEITYGFGTSPVKGYDYKTGKQRTVKPSDPYLVVGTDQVKGRLVKVLFEPRAKLSDSLTYDITAWSLPYAYGLEAMASESRVKSEPGMLRKDTPSPLDPGAYAWLTDWNSMKDARFLADLLKAKIRVRYNEASFSMAGKHFKPGSLIITKLDNKNDKDLIATLSAIAQKHQKTLTPAATGWVDSGKDFGSASVKMIPDVKVAVYYGKPASPLSFGSIWHFFEQQLHYPVSVLDSDYLDRADLSAYDVLILPDAWGEGMMDEERIKTIKEWITKGGKLIALGNALEALEKDESFGLERKKDEKADEELPGIPEAYASGERGQIKNMITGAVFKATVDPTHPLAFGYEDTYFTLKLSHAAYKLLDRGNVVYIDKENAPYSGFAGSEARKLLPRSLVFGVKNYGRGSVVYMEDDPLFRSFWENGKLFFVNAVFMVNNR